MGGQTQTSVMTGITIHKGTWICNLQGHIEEIEKLVRKACLKPCEKTKLVKDLILWVTL